VGEKKKSVWLGNIEVGGLAPVIVQSMTNTSTADVAATCAQISRLERVGCEIVRVAVPDREAVRALPAIISRSFIPIIGDIHFDYRLAVEAIKAGVAGIRINPGNIGSRQGLEEIIAAARDKNIPLRIGVNSGSLPEKTIKRYGSPGAEALWATLEEYIGFLYRVFGKEIFFKFQGISKINRCSDHYGGQPTGCSKPALPHSPGVD